MPALNRQQFWRADPNQMALPGMEEHAHPGAKLLSQGIHFEHEAMTSPGDGPGSPKLHALSAVHQGEEVGFLHWTDASDPEVGMKRGEISMVDTSPAHTRKGVATSLYGMGRTMARVKPQHSTNRTRHGDLWAPSASAKYGGRVPKSKRFDD